MISLGSLALRCGCHHTKRRDAASRNQPRRLVVAMEVSGRRFAVATSLATILIPLSASADSEGEYSRLYVK